MKFTVLTPTYNRAHTLTRLYESLKRQTFKDFEWLVIDDGSPDSCPKICDEYAEKDSRVKVIHKQNGGPSDARNEGIEYALLTESKWIAFIDGDDFIDKNYLSTLYNLVMNNNVSISACNFYYSNCEKSIITTKNVILSTEDFVLEASMAYAPWAKLFKKSFFNEEDKVRFPLGKFFEDERTLYKLLLKADKIAYTNDQLYCYFVNDEGTMHARWNIEKVKDQLSSIIEKFDYLYQNGYYKMLNHSFRFYCELYVDYSLDKKYKKTLLNKDFFYKNVTEIINKYYDVLDKIDSPYYFEIKKNYKEKKKAVRREQYKKIKARKGILYAILWRLKTLFC